MTVAIVVKLHGDGAAPPYETNGRLRNKQPLIGRQKIYRQAMEAILIRQ